MHYRALNPSKYLKAAVDFPTPRTLTIARVELTDMEVEDAPGQKPSGDKKVLTEKKGVVFFADEPKGWVMNVTNAFCLARMFGNDTTTWAGKRVTLHQEQVLSFGEMVPGIRVSGSPDIDADVTAVIKQRKRKERTVVLKKTGGAPAANPSPPKGTPPPDTRNFDALLALARLNQVPPEKAKMWLKTERNRTQPSAVTPEDVEAYRAALAAESPPPPPPDDAPF